MNETISPILYSVLQGYFSVLVFFGFTASIFIHKRFNNPVFEVF